MRRLPTCSAAVVLLSMTAAFDSALSEGAPTGAPWMPGAPWMGPMSPQPGWVVPPQPYPEIRAPFQARVPLVYELSRLGWELVAIKSQLAQREAEVAQMKQDAVVLAQERDHLKWQLESRDTETDATRGALERAQTRVLEVTAALHEAQRQRDEFGTQVAEMEREMDRLRTRLVMTDTSLHERNQAIERLTDERDKLMQRLEHSLTEAARAEGALEGMQVLKTRLEQEVKWRQERLGALDADREDLKQELARLLAQVATLDESLAEQTRCARQFAGERDEVRVRLEQRLADVSDALSRAQGCIGELDSALNASEQRYAASENEKAGLQDQLERVMAEATAARNALEWSETKAVELAAFDQMEERNATLEAERARLLASFEGLKGELRGQTRVLEARLEDELQRVGERERRLEQRIDDQLQTISRMTGELERARAELMSASARLTVISEERDSLRRRLKTADTEQDRLPQEFADVREELSRSNSAVETLTSDIEAVQQAKAGLVGELRTAEEQIAELNESKRASTEKIAELQAERARLLDELTQQKEKSVRLANLEQEAAREIDSLRQDIALREHELSQVRERLSPHEGGSADAEVVQGRIEALRDAYQASYAEHHTRAQQDPSVAADLAQASSDLFREQSLLAHLVDAVGLYTVRSRDSLSSIAQRVYGEAGRWPDIYKANEHLMSDPDKLLPGLVLVIP